MRYRTAWIIGLLTGLAGNPAQAGNPGPQSLQILLQDISTPSGVRFHVAPEIAQDRIQAQPEGTAWPDIIRSLLRGYNYAGTWSAGGKLTEVNVTGRNGDGRAPAAAAPSPGELFAYRPGRSIPAQYRIYAPGSVYPIDVPARRLRNMKKGERLYANLPDGRYALVHDNAWKHDNGDLTWVGYLDGPQGRYRALLTLGEGALAGQILTPGGLYKLESDEGGGQWLVDMEASGLQNGGFEGDESPVSSGVGGAGPLPQSVVGEGAKVKVQDGGGSTQPVDTTATQDGKTRIDVLLLYTAGMGNAGVSTRLNQLMALANQALADSQVNAVFRLAAAQKVGYADRTLNATALDRLTYAGKGFRNIPRLRARYGADVVALVRPFKPQSQGGNCGIAWVDGGGDTPLTADQAFAVVGYGAAGGYYCSDYALAHEIGHVMGATHDRAHATTPGKFPYSYGYGIPGQFGDIMSYYDPEVGVYANPDLAVCAGSACGVPIDQPGAANVALTFNQTAPTVAAFSRSTSP
ncbi:Metallo-peptidase family M12B Reprolysin-like [Methylomagnum ishizawai]|uniref:Metallo-peptidase family M12B Reprolysin-like n=1 Tax=Methylomagnum ishizawai TaxID=1760988 RepID=A0A1Y6CVZ3_9GAMM|nr:zinc-dependent metalloprotease family protein [Methylomagnum ishizawai]SMF94818.1 Metallo-peptidase family M12B Reprolysin-like [Methylomagnum ishizawai]